jgi:MFS family permease
MMAMRFAGDALIPTFGERKLLYFTVFVSFLAIAVTIMAATPLMGILGYLLLGAGVALGAPILFNAAARVPGFAPGAGLATYATFSFIGFLLGPPVIGLIAEHYGLPRGFLMVAVITLSMALAVRHVGHLRE